MGEGQCGSRGIRPGLCVLGGPRRRPPVLVVSTVDALGGHGGQELPRRRLLRFWYRHKRFAKVNVKVQLQIKKCVVKREAYSALLCGNLRGSYFGVAFTSPPLQAIL